MTLAALGAAARAERLFVSGVVGLVPEDGLPPDVASLVLLSPDEPGFWPHVLAEPEFTDGAADPLDRWSARIVTGLAERIGGIAVFPFDGPPWRPFFDLALRSGRAWQSPVNLLVHDRMGLMASYRGAIALRDPPPSVRAAPSPCIGCPAPCREACPVHALGSTHYDLAACHAHLDSSCGKNCLYSGCLVRRACPLSVSYGRLAQQSAWHMRQFHK